MENKPQPGGKIREMQVRYAEGLTEGLTKRAAAIRAGYSPTTHPDHIEKSSRVNEDIQKALERKGIKPDWLADQYLEGVTMAKQDGAKNKDLNALSQLLKNLGFLLTGGKQGPAVAVQINNGASGQINDIGRVEEAIGELRAVLEVLRGEVGLRESSGVLEADIEPTSLPAHRAVDDSGEHGEQVGGGGGEGPLQV